MTELNRIFGVVRLVSSQHHTKKKKIHWILSHEKDQSIISDMSGKYFVTEPNGYLEPRIAKEGVAAWPAQTVIEVFQSVVDRFGNEPALCYKNPVNVS